MQHAFSTVILKAAFTQRQRHPVVYLHGNGPRRPGVVYLD
jgi:hypothetical protein